MTIIKDDKIIITRGNFFLSPQVLEGIVKYIIPLYIRVMLKRLSIVSIHPSTNANKLEELQIKTNNRSKLPRIQIGNGEIKNHMDFFYIY